MYVYIYIVHCGSNKLHTDFYCNKPVGDWFARY